MINGNDNYSIRIIKMINVWKWHDTYHKELSIKNNCINIHPKGRTPPIITPGIGWV